jgi:hypothetical protein
MHNNNNSHNFKIEQRRREVASMLTQSMTETEIAKQLDVWAQRNPREKCSENRLKKSVRQE